jgi:hypothetical protein
MRGGPIFAYETPVVGFPWSIPYEFPVYQIIAALLSGTGVPLDAAGRIVSFAFFVGCLWPMHVLFRALRFDDTAFPCAAMLFLLCPLYLFWGRTFMVETCALFFSLLWLAYLARFFAEPRPATAAIALVAGCLGVLAKATTFPAFAVLGGLLLLKKCYDAWTAGVLADRARPLLFAFLVIATPFVLGGAWTVYSDTVKTHNEIGVRLTSFALARWNFGTWGQRAGATLWRDVVWRRALSDAFGYAAIPALALIVVASLSRKYLHAVAACVLAFLVPFLVFANLHIVHAYYQTANAIFIVAAAGLAVAALMRMNRNYLALLCLGGLVGGQLLYFRSAYAGLLTNDFSLDPRFRIANLARSATGPDTGLVVIGGDWSSVIPYYAQRRSLAIPHWATVASWRRMLAAPQKYLGGVPLGGVVYCSDHAPQDAERKAVIEAFIGGRAVIGEAGPCKLLAPATASSGLSFQPRVGLARQQSRET